MKGPGLRLLIDVRREWKCPRCGYVEHVGAQTTAVACPCCPGVYMKLIERRKVFADELQQLRDRPKLMAEGTDVSADEAFLEQLPTNPTSTDVAASEASSSPTDGDTQRPSRRRGKRPRKQPLRGQHKQQSHSPPPPSEGEE